MKEIPELYGGIDKEAFQMLVNALAEEVADLNYRPVGMQEALAGELADWTDLSLTQWLYQHSQGYINCLGLNNVLDLEELLFGEVGKPGGKQVELNRWGRKAYVRTST